MNDTDEVAIGGAIVKKAMVYQYYALYKPIGIESTFDKKRADNLSSAFPFGTEFFVAGRLDKASEGLLLISNDGKWVNEMSSPASNKEKEYVVEVEQTIDDTFIEKMRAGVDIGFCVTRPCVVHRISDHTFSIILTEGKNRQIRRMCLRLGFYVTALKRIRIDGFYISDLKELEYRQIILT